MSHRKREAWSHRKEEEEREHVRQVHTWGNDLCNGVLCVKKQGKTKRKRVRFGGSFLFPFGGVNKSQGQTFQKVAIYLPSPVFAHGQHYVALSRARVGDPTNITIMFTHPPLHGQPSPALTTPNVVYKQVFVYPTHQSPTSHLSYSQTSATPSLRACRTNLSFQGLPYFLKDLLAPPSKHAPAKCELYILS